MDKKRYVLLSCIFLAIASVPVMSWSTVIEISMQPDHESWKDWEPDIAVDTDGHSYITWTSCGLKSGEITTDIFMRKVSSSGDPGPVVNVSTHPDNIAYEEEDPQIAIGTLGKSYITFSGWDGTSYQIYWANVFFSSFPGTAKKISTHPDNTTNHNYHPQIASYSGNSYVVWYGSDGNDYEIYWVKISATGIPGIVQKISTHADNAAHHDSDPRITLDSAGNSYVVWRGFDGNDYEIYGVKINPSGISGPVQKISTHADNADNGDYDPRITLDSAGNSYVVWRGFDGNDCEIYWVKISATGSPWPVQKISTHADNADNGDYDPQITPDSAGNSFVVWKGFDGNDCEIYWVKISETGIPGSVQKISTHADNENNRDYRPQIGVDASGNSHITWICDDGDNSDLDIYCLLIDSEGNPGNIQKISVIPDDLDFDEMQYLDIVVDTSGYSYITWSGQSGPYDWQIYLVFDRI